MGDYYVSPSLIGDYYVSPSLMEDYYVFHSLMGGLLCLSFTDGGLSCLPFSDTRLLFLSFTDGGIIMSLLQWWGTIMSLFHWWGRCCFTINSSLFILLFLCNIFYIYKHAYIKIIDYFCCFVICSWSFTNWTGLMFFNQIWPSWCFMDPCNNYSM
jgi:hypothetical protein